MGQVFDNRLTVIGCLNNFYPLKEQQVKALRFLSLAGLVKTKGGARVFQAQE